jgi:pimeloyl-ACP methyl ester carboxylesterase
VSDDELPGLGKRWGRPPAQQRALQGRRRGRHALHLRPPRDPLVLLHPFSLCAEVWNRVVPRLTDYHDVHSLRIPGHLGAAPLPTGMEHSIERLVDILEAKLDALHLRKVHLAGASLGGWLALELARRGRARSVVALAPAEWRPGSKEERRLVRMFKLSRRLLQVAGPLSDQLGSIDMVRRTCFAAAIAAPSRLAALDAALILRAGWQCTAYESVIAALAHQPPARPFEQSCPISLMWGDRDRVLPLEGYSEHWRSILPYAEWRILKGMGHLPMYDDPNAVADAILDVTRAASTTAARVRCCQ